MSSTTRSWLDGLWPESPVSEENNELNTTESHDHRVVSCWTSRPDLSKWQTALVPSCTDHKQVSNIYTVLASRSDVYIAKNPRFERTDNVHGKKSDACLASWTSEEFHVSVACILGHWFSTASTVE